MENFERVSNCCGAGVFGPDENGHGTCGECGENCTTEIMCPHCETWFEFNKTMNGTISAQHYTAKQEKLKKNSV